MTTTQTTKTTPDYERVTVTVYTEHSHESARQRLISDLAYIPRLPDTALATEIVMHGREDYPMPETLVYRIALKEEATKRGLTAEDLDEAVRGGYVVVDRRTGPDFAFYAPTAR